MKRRVHIAIVAVLALMINSVCLCAAAVPECTAAARGVREHHGTCPAHQQPQNSRAGHDCCQTAACNSATVVGAETDAHAINHLSAPPPTIFRTPVFDLAVVASRFHPTWEVHSRPPGVPIFLAIRTLLL